MHASDAFLSGKLVDENGLPPLTATYTLVTEGNFQRRLGFLRVQEDRVDAEGTFVTGPLPPGKYFVRFFGVLQDPASPAEPRVHQNRLFDFLYRNAETVSKASPIQLQSGEKADCVFTVPKPRWFDVAGHVTGNLPVSDEGLYVMFERDMDILRGIGGVGFPVSPDGRFQSTLQKGSYFVSVHEMTGPEEAPNRTTRSIRQFGSTTVRIEHDTRDLEVQLN